MLLHLTVENYALIEKLDIGFKPGMTIITGETGAGKSILLGALSLILGQRADTGVLLDKQHKCIVEGVFEIGAYGLESFFETYELDNDAQVIIRREINPQGKSRAFINDTPVNLNVLRELAERLIDVHSQHRVLEINDATFQTEVIDSFAQQQQTVVKYRREFRQYRAMEQQLQALQEEDKRSAADRDYFQFQYNELEQAQLVAGELEKLETELQLLTNAETIRENYQRILCMLSDSDDNILSQLSAAHQLLVQMGRYDTESADYAKRLHSQHLELKELAGEMERRSEKVATDPKRADEIGGRLDIIQRLLHKHHAADIPELLVIRTGFEEKLAAITSLDGQIRKIQEELDQQRQKVMKLADLLRKGRLSVIPHAGKHLLSLLKNLGMPDARIEIECRPAGYLHASGSDHIRFLFNANKGGELNEISKVASGGELSRLMLAVKSLVSQKNLIPTIIFDEIDSGVSGETAAKVAEIMLALSRNMQLIAITHLPQIAARGNTHLKVFKKSGTDATHTYIKVLTTKERESEIAQMISGADFSEASLKTARELIGKQAHR